MNWYKFSQNSWHTATDLTPEFVEKNGLSPQFNPAEWGIGGDLMPPSIFLGTENIVREKYFKKPYGYLYTAINLDINYFFPDLPSLVDFGAYFTEDSFWWENQDNANFESIAHLMSSFDEGDIPISSVSWRDVFQVTGTIAYTQLIPPADINLVERWQENNNELV